MNPCRTQLPKAGTKSRDAIERIHQRSEGYDGVDLFRSVHCTLAGAFPQAREIACPEHDWAGKLTVAIAFEMKATPTDEKSGPFEYFRIRMYPEEYPGDVLIVMFDRALRRAGSDLYSLNDLTEYQPDDGVSVADERLDRVWITAESWPDDQPILERVFTAINRQWETERGTGRE